MPPRRRAFRSNDFGLKPTTIPRDAKRQAEPPSRQGTHSHQNHFHFNPSRILVELNICFAASNAQPRLNVLPRRDFPAHVPLPGVAALVPRALTPGYRALAPAGAAQGKILSIILPSSCPCRGCSRKTFNYYLSSIVPEEHTLNNPTQATKERSGAGRRHRCPLAAWESACHEAPGLFAAKGRRWKKALFGDLLMSGLCHHVDKKKRRGTPRLCKYYCLTNRLVTHTLSSNRILAK